MRCGRYRGKAAAGVLLFQSLRFLLRIDHAFVGGDSLWQQIAPPIFRERAGEERALSAKLHGVLIKVVHEFIDQRERDQLDLIGRQRKLSDEDIAAGGDAALGFSSQHGANLYETTSELRSL